MTRHHTDGGHGSVAMTRVGRPASRPPAVRAWEVGVKLNVNGAGVEVNDRSAKCPLLWVLRDVLGLRGTKYGCGIGYCAACTVLIDGRSTKSCQTQAGRAVGTAVTTVEGESATTGPRFSVTRARSRHPGSPDARSVRACCRACAASKTWDGSRPSLTTARAPTSHPCHLARPLTNFPDTGEGASMCCDRRASRPAVRAER